MPTTLNLPTEGTTFRATGDNTGSTLYTVKNGQLQTLAPAQFQANTDLRLPDGTVVRGGSFTNQDIRRVGTPVNPGYTGTYATAYSAQDWYNQQNGSGKYEALPTFNMADLNTALAKGVTLGNTATFDINTDPSIAGNVNPNTANPTTGLQQNAGQAASLQNTAPSPFGANYSPLGVPINPTPPSPPASGPIGSSSLDAPTTQTYQQSSGSTTPTVIHPAGSYSSPTTPPALTATAQETQMSDLTKQLMDLNTQESGKAQYQNEQNAAAGVTAAQATKNSLVAQRQKILNDHAAAQLATQQGQGVTTAVDARQRAEETRQSAIQELSVSSLIAAADGDLANAQTLADQAVAKKFDPIEADIKARTANLALIANDPNTSLADKNRAMAAQAQLDTYKAQVAQAKDDAASVLDIAAKAAANGADALTIQAITQSATPADALKVAASQGALQKDATPKILGNASSGYFQYDPTTGQITPIGSGSGSSSASFSTTQINNGAQNAALSIADFKTLNSDVQNFYINASSANIADLNAAISAVKSGGISVTDAKTQVDALTVAPAVKDYIKSQIDKAAPGTSHANGNVLQTIWNNISGFLGI